MAAPDNGDHVVVPKHLSTLIRCCPQAFVDSVDRRVEVHTQRCRAGVGGGWGWGVLGGVQSFSERPFPG